jgi:hypothetical protein
MGMNFTYYGTSVLASSISIEMDCPALTILAPNHSPLTASGWIVPIRRS